MWERDLAAKKQAWQQERHQFQQDILNLQNSTDAKIIEGLEVEVKKKQQTINNLVNTLGSEDIKSLSDLENLLAGKTLKELKQTYQSEVSGLFEQLQAVKEKLQFYTDNLKTKEQIISDYQKDEKEWKEYKNQAQNALQNWVEWEQVKNQKTQDLEKQLLNLAKQKLASKKEAKELVNQLQAQWQAKQAEWESEREQAQQQQDLAAQTLAQTKANHAEQVRHLKHKHQQEQNRVKEKGEQKLAETKENLETKISSLELKLEVNQRELTEKQTKINELTEWSAGQHNRILELETSLNLAGQEKANLEREKGGLQGQLQSQRTVLERLQTNREEELAKIEEENYAA